MFKATAHDIASVLDDSVRLRNELLKYVIAGKEASRGTTDWSRCIDKANVGARSLQTGLIVLSNNQAILTCPQAASLLLLLLFSRGLTHSPFKQTYQIITLPKFHP